SSQRGKPPESIAAIHAHRRHERRENGTASKSSNRAMISTRRGRLKALPVVEGHMNHRRAILGALTVAAAVLLVIPLAAQTGNAGAKTAAKAWTPPRAADGHADLSGVWSHNAATPFERPKELEGREFLTAQEVENLKRNAAELFNGDTDAAFGDSVFLAALRKNDNFKSTDTTGNYNHFCLVDREF